MKLGSNFSKFRDSPVAFTAEYKGESDMWSIYKMETKERVEKDKFPFIVLEEKYSCMRGFNKFAQKGIYSNMVSDTRKETMIVKLNGGEEIARGLYKEIKQKVDEKGGRYNKILFVYVDGIGIGKIYLAGGSLTGWFDLKKEVDLSEVPVIEQESARQESNNFGEYNIPVFRYNAPSKELKMKAEEAYEKLTEYLNGGEVVSEESGDDGEMGNYILAADEADKEHLEKNWRLIARKIEDHDDADVVLKAWQKKVEELELGLTLSLDPDAEYTLPF